jgi:hypothetical protein
MYILSPAAADSSAFTPLQQPICSCASPFIPCRNPRNARCAYYKKCLCETCLFKMRIVRLEEICLDCQINPLIKLPLRLSPMATPPASLASAASADSFSLKTTSPVFIPKLSPPIGQTWFMDIMIACGYSINKKGCCHGFSIAALEYILEDKVYLFFQLIREIYQNLQSYKEQQCFLNAIERYKNGRDMSSVKPDYRRFINSVRMVFETVSLGQRFDSYKDFPIQDGNSVLDILNLGQEESKKRYISTKNYVFCESPIKLIVFLEELQKHCFVLFNEDPIGFLLSSKNHTIVLAWYPRKGFTLIDSNELFCFPTIPTIPTIVTQIAKAVNFTCSNIAGEQDSKQESIIAFCISAFLNLEPQKKSFLLSAEKQKDCEEIREKACHLDLYLRKTTLNSEVNIPALVKLTPQGGMQVLYLCCETNDFNQMLNLFQIPGMKNSLQSRINEFYEHGFNLLMYACYHGSCSIAQYFIEELGAKIDIRQQKTHNSILHIAIHKENLELCQYLLSVNITLIKLTNIDSKTALDFAIAEKKIALIAYLREKNEEFDKQRKERFDKLFGYSILRDARLPKFSRRNKRKLWS